MSRNETLSAGKWAAISQLIGQGTQFIVAIILANLLPPTEFGLLAMVSVFMALSMIVVQGGMAGALIQRQDITDRDRSTVFWFNLATALSVVAILNLMAPAVARFFSEERLELILRILSVRLVISAFGTCQAAIREKKMEFKALMRIGYPSQIVGAVVAISMAYSGCGVWSLVALALVSALMNSVVLWLASDWRPSFTFDRQRFGTLFSYGGNMAGAELLNIGFQNAYVLVIAKLFPPSQLAFYQRAQSFQRLPATQLNGILRRILFPLMSRHQNDRAKLHYYMNFCLRINGLVSVPFFAILAALAEPFVLTLIGEPWRPTIGYLQLFCVLGVLWGVSVQSIAALQAIGKAGTIFRLDLAKKIIVMITIAITYRYGIAAMIWGQIACGVIGTCLNTYFTNRYIQFSLRDNLRILSKYTLASLIAAAVAYIGISCIDLQPILELIIGSMLGLGAILLGLSTIRGPFIRDIVSLVPDRWRIRTFASYIFRV